ncbi:hypothetical protein V9T40_001634 [Parthenolecanium corni]|uniref:Uncharacterized protein n=1 Tax=Parthenolecanium corni TaxID=536013 RepID=A0AAN9Y5B1_9HEMI
MALRFEVAPNDHYHVTRESVQKKEGLNVDILRESTRYRYHSPILGHNPPQSPARVKDYGALEEVMAGSYIPEIQENVEQVDLSAQDAMIQKLTDQLEIAKHRIQTLERIIAQQGDRLHQLLQKPVNVPKKVVVKYFHGGDIISSDSVHKKPYDVEGQNGIEALLNEEGTETLSQQDLDDSSEEEY